MRSGDVDTGLIERLGDEVAAPEPPPELAALALVTMLGEPADDDPWSDRRGWRMQGPAWIRRTLDGPPSIADQVAVRSALEGGPSGAAWEWQVGESSGVLTYDGTHPGPAPHVDGPKSADIERFSARQHRVSVYADEEAVWVVDPDVGPVRFAPAATDSDAAAGGEASLEAPMPGTVVQLRVEPGAVVTAGETLVVMESMKMEISIQAPRDGTVETVLVAAGDQVDRGAILIELAEEDA